MCLMSNFDYSMGMIRLELRQMSMMAACIKKIKLPNQPNEEIDGCFLRDGSSSRNNSLIVVVSLRVI